MAGECLPASAETELCRWRVTNRSRGWATLAGLAQTERQVALLCEFRLDAAPEDANPCTLHPREAELDPDEYALDVGVSETRFERARNLVAVSRLVGEVPVECQDQGPDQVCEWKVSNRDQGFGVVAALAGHTGATRLFCQLPKDGSARAAKSCFAAPGSGSW